MILKGVASAVSSIPAFPDLAIGLPEEAPLITASLSGLWNAAYALGWALGPVLGGVLVEALQVNWVCLGEEECSRCGTGPEFDCNTSWVSDNGFDGFATITALVSLFYAAVLALAAVCGVKGYL